MEEASAEEASADAARAINEEDEEAEKLADQWNNMFGSVGAKAGMKRPTISGDNDAAYGTPYQHAHKTRVSPRRRVSNDENGDGPNAAYNHPHVTTMSPSRKLSSDENGDGPTSIKRISATKANTRTKRWVLTTTTGIIAPLAQQVREVLEESIDELHECVDEMQRAGWIRVKGPTVDQIHARIDRDMLDGWDAPIDSDTPPSSEYQKFLRGEECHFGHEHALEDDMIQKETLQEPFTSGFASTWPIVQNVAGPRWGDT